MTNLTSAGVDLFHASTHVYSDPAFEGSNLTLAGWTQKLSGIPTIAVGKIGVSNSFGAWKAGQGAEVDTDLSRLEKYISENEFALCAVGRAALGDPRWAEKVKMGNTNEILKFTPDCLKELL